MVALDKYTPLEISPNVEITYEPNFTGYEYQKYIEIKVYSFIDIGADKVALGSAINNATLDIKSTI